MIEFIIKYWELILTTLVIPFIIFLYKKNIGYSKLINYFKDNLPRSDKKAKEITDEEKKKMGLHNSYLKHFKVLNLSPHKSTVSESDINLFLNKIEHYNYTFVIFHKHYKSITKNLKRFKKVEAKDKNFDLVMIQEVLDSVKLGFFEILWYKLAIKGRFKKYTNKFRFYMWNKTKNNRWIK